MFYAVRPLRDALEEGILNSIPNTEMNGRKSSEDDCRVPGLRNSHDQMIPAGIVAGASVFVCDHLGFSGKAIMHLTQVFSVSGLSRPLKTASSA